MVSKEERSGQEGSGGGASKACHFARVLTQPCHVTATATGSTSCLLRRPNPPPTCRRGCACPLASLRTAPWLRSRLSDHLGHERCTPSIRACPSCPPVGFHVPLSGCRSTQEGRPGNRENHENREGAERQGPGLLSALNGLTACFSNVLIATPSRICISFHI